MPRQEPAEDRERQIIEAAMAVFAREGFHDARMEDIAKESQLGKGTLYLYFKGKDAIISALLRYFFSAQLKDLKAIEWSDAPVTDQLVAYLQRLTAATERFAIFSSIAYEFYAVAGRNKDVRRFFAQFYADYRAALAEVIQRGITSGEFRAIDPDAIALALLALFEGFNLIHTVDGASFALGQTTEAAMRLLLDAIRA